jgi:hypothetical protein
VRPGHGYPFLLLWGLSDALYDLRINCLPHIVHLKTYLGPNLGVPIAGRLRFFRAVRGPLMPGLVDLLASGRAEIGPDCVSSTAY